MTDIELAAFEADIIAFCAEHEQSHGQERDYCACVTIESKKAKYFIKFYDSETLWPEFSTQSYIYDYAMRHKNGPHIPQPLHYFESQDECVAFLVMEYIELADHSLITNLAERTAWALDWLSKVSAPPEDIMDPSKEAMGPVGGGFIRHRFFKNYQAPVSFQSVADLQFYMNEVRRCLYSFEYPPSDNIIFGQGLNLLPKLATNPEKPIIIINDPLIFTQSDMHVSNFGVDMSGNTVLLDFSDIGRLPLSFAKYNLQSRNKDSFIARVANILCWLDNSNISPMGSASSCLWMTADPRLGATT